MHLVSLHKSVDDLGESVKEMKKDQRAILAATEKYNETLYHPKTGIIVQRDRDSDHMRWTIYILICIGLALSYFLGVANSLKDLLP